VLHAHRWAPGPSRFVEKTLRRVAGAPVGKYIEVDDGSACWAACKLVALAFGYGDAAGVDDAILDVVAKLRPKEEQRGLALDVLSRIANGAASELASLWHEGNDAAKFDSSLADLRTRLETASGGPRELPKPKTGDVIVLPITTSPELIVVEVVGSGEVAVFEGTCPDPTAALESVKHRPARRVPTSVNRLLRRGSVIGKAPIRKDLEGKKFYAFEMGAIEHYALATANGAGVRSASYEEGEVAICCSTATKTPFGRSHSELIRSSEFGRPTNVRRTCANETP
jgi:hypothetical protein